MGAGGRSSKPRSRSGRGGGRPPGRGGVAKGASGFRALKGKGGGKPPPKSTGKPPRQRRDRDDDRVISEGGDEIGIDINVEDRTVRGGARSFDRDGPRRSRDGNAADERPGPRPRRGPGVLGVRGGADDGPVGPGERRGAFRPREDRPMGPGGLMPGGTGIGGRGGFGGRGPRPSGPRPAGAGPS